MILLQEAILAGARQTLACAILGFNIRTIQRWTDGDTVMIDQRPLQKTVPVHKLTLAERATVLAVANSAEFAHLPPSQIVPRLADQQRYIASESTFYRVLRAQRINSNIVAPSVRRKCAVNRRPCAPSHRINCIAGTSLTWRARFRESIFTCIYFSIYSAEKSSAGRYTQKKAVKTPAT
ncbi:hypothetical protein GKO28_12735 [Deefgea sp. CFH1-16]|nr:hypothetical protein [Deefgea sp. CFH1-16]